MYAHNPHKVFVPGEGLCRICVGVVLFKGIDVFYKVKNSFKVRFFKVVRTAEKCTHVCLFKLGVRQKRQVRHIVRPVANLPNQLVRGQKLGAVVKSCKLGLELFQLFAQPVLVFTYIPFRRVVEIPLFESRSNPYKFVVRKSAHGVSHYGEQGNVVEGIVDYFKAVYEERNFRRVIIPCAHIAVHRYLRRCENVGVHLGVALYTAQKYHNVRKSCVTVALGSFVEYLVAAPYNLVYAVCGVYRLRLYAFKLVGEAFALALRRVLVN